VATTRLYSCTQEEMRIWPLSISHRLGGHIPTSGKVHAWTSYIFYVSEICEQAPSLLHAEVDESRFYNHSTGSTADTPWVGVG
jgi:hypothetical protein